MANTSKKKSPKKPVSQPTAEAKVETKQDKISAKKQSGIVRFIGKIFVFVEHNGGLTKIVKPAGDIKIGDKVEF